MDEVEAIERATLAAVPPQRLVQWHRWLLAFDDGTVGRCHSAVPLRHEAPPPGVLAGIEHRYADAGLPAVLRVPELAPFDAMRGELEARGYRRTKPTLVQVGRVADVARSASGRSDVELTDTPSADWEQVFLGEGFDPVDGASRLAILRRGRGSVFASVHEHGRTVAVGSACFSEGWCGVHGMRTLPAQRGRGLASAVLAALGQAAHERGIERCFLQVQQDNAAACSLYAARGFATAWGYAYWKKA
ncbi:MAG TPA: GNAT family N-acetyltransferase [Ramlibacter sp.]